MVLKPRTCGSSFSFLIERVMLHARNVRLYKVFNRQVSCSREYVIQKNKVDKGKVVPVLNYWKSGCMKPHIPDLGTSWR
jgi:hypothetical protein